MIGQDLEIYMLFSLAVQSAIPYFVAYVYYGKILAYARKMARQEESERRHHDNNSVILDNTVNHANATQDVTGAIFDDNSDDDDLIDPVESPSAKQSGASKLAMYTLLLKLISRIICVSLLSYYPFSGYSLSAIAGVMSMTKFPMALAISVLNFRPLKNKVGEYTENLPDRLEELWEPVAEWFGQNSGDEQRRSIVADESDGGSSSDEARTDQGARRRNTIVSNLIGTRISAVSPFGSPVISTEPRRADVRHKTNTSSASPIV